MIATDCTPAPSVFSLGPASFEQLFGTFPQPVLVMVEQGLACVAANREAFRVLNGGSTGLRTLDLENVCSAKDLTRWLNVRAAAADGTWLTWQRQQRGGGRPGHIRFNAVQVDWEGCPAELQVYLEAGESSSPADTPHERLAGLAACGLGRYSVQRHRLLLANPSLTEMLGGPSAREMDAVQPALHGTLPDLFAAAFLHTQEWARFLEQAEAGLAFESVCVWRAGLTGRSRVRLRAQPQQTPRGTEVLFSAVNAGPELDHVRQNQQSQRMEALGRMAGGVAHDFNNLLTVIRGHAEILEEDLPAGSALRGHAARLLTAARQAAEITGTLLTFSRQEQEDAEPASIRQPVAEALQLIASLLPASITLDSDVGTGDVTVSAQPSHIGQVLMNLALNARDAMPNGGRLSIRTGWEPAPGSGTPGYAVLEVSDTGLGMDAETQAHIFEPFYTTKSRGRGTGLGLALVRAIVTQYDGGIEVDSEPGRGTTFRVKLPACSAPEAGVTPVQTGTAANGCRVLLVDDEPEIRHMVGSFLERLGYEVLQAGDAREALLCVGVNGERIDLLLTDVVMPHTDGFELALMLREQLPGLPVVVMSGFTGGALARKGKELGNVPFLSKPFSLRQLEACLKTAAEPHWREPAFA